LFPVIICFLGFIIVLAISIAEDSGPTNACPTTVNSYTGKLTIPTNCKYVDPLTKTVDSMPWITPFFFGGVGIWFLIAWAFNQQMILSLTKSKSLTREENPRVYNIVENLCISRGLPVPKIYIMEESSLNAFASGLSPKNAIIGFTRGILEKLDDKELEAVAAHEITHIMNYDTRLMLVAIIFVGIIQTMSEVFFRVRFSGSGKKNDGAAAIFLLQIVALIVGFLVTALIQSAISRKREFLGDAGSVELVKSSQPLISALMKISQDPGVEAINNQSVSQMFLYNPRATKLSSLFASHPPIEERIKALQAIG
jgi:heat shock protein HtpX